MFISFSHTNHVASHCITSHHIIYHVTLHLYDIPLHHTTLHYTALHTTLHAYVCVSNKLCMFCCVCDSGSAIGMLSESFGPCTSLFLCIMRIGFVPTSNSLPFSHFLLNAILNPSPTIYYAISSQWLVIVVSCFSKLGMLVKEIRWYPHMHAYTIFFHASCGYCQPLQHQRVYTP